MRGQQQLSFHFAGNSYESFGDLFTFLTGAILGAQSEDPRMAYLARPGARNWKTPAGRYGSQGPI